LSVTLSFHSDVDIAYVQNSLAWRTKIAVAAGRRRLRASSNRAAHYVIEPARLRQSA